MIYFDNSATTNPKPKSVIQSVNTAMRKFSFNSGRGGYQSSIDTAKEIFSVREKVADMFNLSVQNVVFTNNCTTSLNMAIKGSVKKGDHIIISSLEHNAVARCVESLALNGIVEYDIADYSFDKSETINNFNNLIKNNTALIVCTYASNAFGCVLPVKEIGALAKQKDVRFIVDAAQGAGVFDIDMKRDNIDILCIAGHKGLYAPLAVGVMCVGDGVYLNTILEGGTGSMSLSLRQPEELPDRFEAGTLNNSGIIGLGAGIDFVNSIGIENIKNHEMQIINTIYNSLSNIDAVKLYTPNTSDFKTAPILSFNYKDFSSEKTASLLAEKGIALRGGLHCAPLAHKHFSTLSFGTVRLSPSVFSNQRECEIFINSLKNI